MYPFTNNSMTAAAMQQMMNFNVAPQRRTPSYGNNRHMMRGNAPAGIIIRPNDVLCGRGKTSFNHSGNRRFRHVISQSIDEYRAATSKWEKSLVAARLVSVIHQSGGRFLKQKKDNEDQWYELSSSESKSKVSHAIRDAIAATKPSRRSSHESTSSMKSDTKASTVPSSCSSSSATPMDDCSSSTAATTPMDDSSRMDDSSDSANGHSLARSRYRGTWSSNSLVSLSEADSDKEVATTKPDRPTSLRNEEWASSSDEDAAGSDYDGTDEFASYIHSVLGPAHP